MKVLIVIAHPEQQSFNHAMVHTAKESFEELGHTVKISDLYKIKFNPLSDRHNFKTVKNADYLKLPIEEYHATKVDGFNDELEKEIQKLEWCDFMIWQFPLWWFGMPAALKGWVDRVFAAKRIYSSKAAYDNGLFKGKSAMLSVTTGGSIKSYIQGGLGGDLLDILKPIHRGMLEFIGFDVLRPHFVYAPTRMTDEERVIELAQYALRLRTIFTEDTIDVGVF